MRQVYIPTISELQAFCVCAQTGATTRAAQALNLTQSAISRSINSLEKRLGVQLFDRVRQRLILSDAGRAFQRDAARVLADLENSAMMVMAFGGHSDVLRLAVLPTFASTWLIPKLGDFQTLFPKVTFDIGARLKPVDFEVEAFDAAIQRGGATSPGVKFIPLMDEYLVAVAAPELAETSGNFDEGEAADFSLLQQATRPDLWPRWFEQGGLDQRTILRGARFDHFDMVKEAAISALGVALVPESLVQRELGAGTLILLSERKMAGPEPYMLIYPERSEDITGFNSFKNWVISVARNGN
ncbi:MAG: LysR family transcriptional regulator [Devosiaceae bacterium]|nr:LysR family transcriptional regulator [Devosiaceae bacterium]